MPVQCAGRSPGYCCLLWIARAMRNGFGVGWAEPGKESCHPQRIDTAPAAPRAARQRRRSCATTPPRRKYAATARIPQPSRKNSLWASQITANQRQYSRTFVLVFKDLADHKDFIRIALEPAAHASLLWKLQLIYASKTLLFPVLFAQGDQTVIFECRNEMLLLASDE